MNPTIQPPDPASRPSRITCPGQIAVAALLTLSFVSGVMIWWGKGIQSAELASPVWLRTAVVIHGSLNPLLCILFGYLLCHHIRLGWQMRANLISGFFMEFVFAALILTGVGLYYAGTDLWRDRFIFLHHLLGVLLPISLAVHWIAGLLWARKQASA